MICEYVVVGLAIARRRWALLVVPVAVAICIAVIFLKTAPITYEAKSLILLQSANRATGLSSSPAYARQSAMEQVAAVEAWLKSDQVLRGLVPRLVDPQDIKSQNELLAQIQIFRSRLTLELVGGSALEVTLGGPSPVGLGRKLDVIVARLMEGLTGPEQSIQNALQFVHTRRREDAASTETALARAISAAGLRDFDNTIRQLGRLHELERMIAVAADPSAQQTSPSAAELMRQAEIIRGGFGVDRRAVQHIERAFSEFRQARARAEEVVARPSNTSNFVGIFDSPENLLLVGRPQDPLAGQSAGRKWALLGVLLSLAGGAGLVLLAEFLAGKLRFRADFEAAAGLPVVARFSKGRTIDAATSGG